MNRQLILVVIVAALSGAVTSMINDRWGNPSPKIAVINPTVLVAEQLKQIEPGLDEKAIQARGQAYAKHLDETIAQIAKQYNAVILVSPAVITGAPDLTDEVRRRIDGPR
jgi:hypothetical protein